MTLITAEDRAALATSPRVTIRQIIDEVCTETGHDPRAILSPSRCADDVRVRDAVCFIARRHGFSLNQIGRVLNRDHTTIMDAASRERARRQGATA